MVDKSGLQVIGWLFASTTAAVMLIAALLVGEATASNQAGVAAPLAAASFAAETR